MRKLVYVTGSRADYGLMRNTLKEIEKDPGLDLKLIVTGMHLLKTFGHTIDEIKKDNFEIAAELPIVSEEDTREEMAKAIGRCIIKTAETLAKLKPDLVLIEADRYEILGAVIAASYMNIPVAHFSGGDVSGTMDEPARQAIARFAHIHFPGTNQSAERLVKMGEEPRRIFMVGSPGVGDEEITEKQEIAKEFNLDLDKPILLVVQHPVTTEYDSKYQMEQTMLAVKETGMQAIVIYPNVDAGGISLIEVIKKYESGRIKAYKNLPREKYLGLMKVASVMVGNSSSAIVEAPSFELPAVNIGSREKNRERAGNVIDATSDREEILDGIKKALSKEFREEIKKKPNPYAGIDNKKVIEVLKTTEIDKKLLQKRITY